MRGTRERSQTSLSSDRLRGNDTDEFKDFKDSMDLNSIFEEFQEPQGDLGPDWRVPNDFYVAEATQFCSGENGGLPLDHAVASRLLKTRLDDDFDAYTKWYQGHPSLVEKPEDTVPGMDKAGEMLSEAILNGDKIAVFCDYDVDGVTAGEAFRRGVEPYGADLYYGYADMPSGFGLTDDFVRKAHEQGAKILVTLDCGSGQSKQVELAQSLGMKVVVVDHHEVGDNPAEFHLNPELYDPPTSKNTGSALAWKLAASVQQARDGKTRPEHWQEAMQLAGMGLVADMGSLVLPEHRALIWNAHDKTPPGVEALSEALEENAHQPGQMVMTRAVLNLPKRTHKLTASDTSKILSAKTKEEALPHIEKALQVYEEARPKKDEMVKHAIEKIGEAEKDNDGLVVSRPQEDTNFFAAVSFDDYKDFAGYTGQVADKLARATQKPAVVFAYKGQDEHGQDLYKWSCRGSGAYKLGELFDQEDLKDAVTIKTTSQDGETREVPVMGGHRSVGVVSGVCTKDNVKKVEAAMEEWARKKAGPNRDKFFPTPRKFDLFITERLVDPKRLDKIEEEARQLGPFSFSKQLTKLPQKDKVTPEDSNKPIEISVQGKVENLQEDEENENYLKGILKMGEVDREIRWSKNGPECPKEECEWILKVGDGGPYFLRDYYQQENKD